MLARTTITLFVLILLSTLTGQVSTSNPTEREIDQQFTGTVRPFVEAYCVTCYGAGRPMAQFNLTQYKTMAPAVQDHTHGRS